MQTASKQIGTPVKGIEYIRTLLEEKGISLEEDLEIETGETIHFMNIGVILECLENFGQENVALVCRKLRQIDFANGDIRKFIIHCARGVILSNS